MQGFFCVSATSVMMMMMMMMMVVVVVVVVITVWYVPLPTAVLQHLSPNSALLPLFLSGPFQPSVPRTGMITKQIT